MPVYLTIIWVIAICLVASIVATGLKAYVRRGFAEKPPEFPVGEVRLNQAILLKSLRGWISAIPILAAIVIIDDSWFAGEAWFLPFVLILAAFILLEVLAKALDWAFPSKLLRDLEEWEQERIRHRVYSIEKSGDRSIPSDGSGRR